MDTTEAGGSGVGAGKDERVGDERLGGRDKTRVVVLSTATGAYNEFVSPLLESARKYLLADGGYVVSYVIFTDAPHVFERQTGVSYVYRADLGWPLTAMLRYRTFLDAWHLVAHADYILRCLRRLCCCPCIRP